jgi:hypothetical protein
LIWPTASGFKATQIQPIASAILTLSGVLFGFTMASITLFASAKDNVLIRNTTLTGYLPKLVNQLHITMGLLLCVCVVFLSVLFLPDSLTFDFGSPVQKYRTSTVVLMIGLLCLFTSFYFFYRSWWSFKAFTKHM